MRSLPGVVVVLAAALALAGCGTGGPVTGGDTARGKTLFGQKCAACHTLADAGAAGKIGPNLDDAFAAARVQGFKESTIEDIVAGQIRAPNAPTPPNPSMPANLATGNDLAAIAAYVASVAGKSGKSGKSP